MSDEEYLEQALAELEREPPCYVDPELVKDALANQDPVYAEFLAKARAASAKQRMSDG